MGYPKDLDEYTIAELLTEVARRRTAFGRGVCPYCNRLASEPNCRMVGQHELARSILELKQL